MKLMGNAPASAPVFVPSLLACCKQLVHQPAPGCSRGLMSFVTMPCRRRSNVRWGQENRVALGAPCAAACAGTGPSRWTR